MKIAVQLVVLTFAVAANLATPLYAADEYRIDPIHSSATFSVRHLMLARVAGRFTSVSGVVRYDESDIGKSSVEAVISTASVTTDIAMRDQDLKANYFEVDRYPEIVFRSKRIERRRDQLVAVGTLTIKGVSKDIELPFEISKGAAPMGPSIGVSTSIVLNRQDYGVESTKSPDPRGLIVGNEVRTELNLEAHLVKK